MATQTAPAPAKKKKISLFVILIIIIALIITTLIIVKVVKEARNKKKIEEGERGSQDTGTKDTTGFPLQIGSKGENVETLQSNLNTIAKNEFPGKYSSLSVDGDFGSKTKTLLQSVIGTSYYPVSKDTFDKIANRATGTTGTTTTTTTTTTIPQLNKVAYSQVDNLEVWKPDFDGIYKKAKAGEYIGIIKGVKKSSTGSEYYIIGNQENLVYKNLVNVK